MNFTHAVVDGSGNVDLLATGPDGFLIAPGHSVVLLATPVSGRTAPPTPGHTLRCMDGVLSWFDSRTLDQAKVDKWTEIKAARVAAIDRPLVTPYGSFDCGPGDRQNITDAVALLQTLAAAGQPTTVTFTTATNTAVVLTTAQMVNVGLLLGQQVQYAYARARELREQINAATTVAGLDSVIW